MGKKSERRNRKLARKYGGKQLENMGLTPKPRASEVTVEDVIETFMPSTGDLMTDEQANEIIERFLSDDNEVDNTMVDDSEMMGAPTEADFDHEVYADRPKRWVEGENFVIPGFVFLSDSYTGLRAIVGEGEVSRTISDLEKGTNLRDLLWQEPESEAEVFVDSENEGDRYWAIRDEDFGLAILDRFERLVHAFDHTSPDRLFETKVEDAKKLARSFSIDERSVGDRHWITLAEWSAYDTEDVLQEDREEAAAAALTVERGPLRVLIVSSRNWAWTGIVREIVQTYWNQMDNPDMTLVTSGMPFGAEAVAAEFVEAGVHGITHEVIPDNMIRPENVDYAFAFVSNYSEGATKVVERLRAMEIPVHVIEETSAVIPDEWAGR